MKKKWDTGGEKKKKRNLHDLLRIEIKLLAVANDFKSAFWKVQRLIFSLIYDFYIDKRSIYFP